MKTICVFAAVVLILAFSAVNLFIPYALAVFALGVGMAYLFGIPCGLLKHGRRDECRLGFC